jgi:branched-chain amino acid aminotransferase
MNEAERPIWADGELVSAETGVISARDPGFLLGLAVFETLLFENSCLYFVEEHIARLAKGASELSISWPPRWAIQDVLAEYVEQLPAGSASALRVTLTPGAPGAGASLVIDSRTPPLPDRSGVSVILLERQRLAGSPLAVVKSTSRIANHLARTQAHAAGAWEALMATEEGDVAEGSSSNLFVVRGGRAVTPPIERGCLPGIVRDKVLREIADPRLPIEEGMITPDDLRDAEEVFLTSSLARILPVREVQGVRRGLPGVQGPWVRSLSERFTALEERYRTAR